MTYDKDDEFNPRNVFENKIDFEDEGGDEAPEYEDEDGFDDEFDDEESGALRWVSIALVVLAVCGFVGLAWYAYKSGVEPVSEDEIPMVAADDIPLKETPEEPGGWQFEHQDKAVYNQLAAGQTETRPMVERLLPAPEQPVERVVEPVSPEQYEREQVRAPVTETVVEAPKTAATASGTAAQEKEIVKETPVASAAAQSQKPVESKPATEAAAQKPAEQKVVEQKPAAPTPAAPKPVEKKPDEKKVAENISAAPAAAATKPAPQPAAQTARAGQYMAQLGAFSSQADAEAAWGKIRSAHGSTLGGKGHMLQRAEVGGKIYHRLQVGPYDSESAARQLCAHLQQHKQACFIVSVK